MLLCEARDQIAREIWLHGWRGFEAPLPDVFAGCASLSNGRVVLDIGANTGFYSLLAASSAPLSPVHAFEPLDSIAERLAENVVLNNWQDRVSIHQVGVSDTTGRALLYVPTDEHGLLETSASLNRSFKGRHSREIGIECLTVDDWYRSQNRPQVGIMKIDVESQEHRVLRGSPAVLAEARPVLFIEILPGSADVDAIEAVRCQFDYVDMRVTPGQSHGGDCTGADIRVCGVVQADPASWNHLLIPRERLATVLGVLDKLNR